MLARTVETLHRREGGRILAGLIRFCGDFSLAEDALQEAITRALIDWRDHGMPNNAAAWLTTVAKRWLVDQSRKTRREFFDEDAIDNIEAPETSDPARVLTDRNAIDDDLLRLIFTCCHPAISPNAQAVLALNTICRLTVPEIARAYLEPEATTAQRLVRAKRKIADAKIPFVIPEANELPDRLDVVLDVIYLVFNEGYTGATSHSLMRISLCDEAIRLGKLVTSLLPNHAKHAEALGLLSLMQLHHARRAARVDKNGDLVSLEEQDRSRWDHDAIRAAISTLDQALLLRQPGPRQIEAAIASLHCQAMHANDTDWHQIAALYSSLYRHRANDVVALNGAVAYALAFSIDEGLARIDAIAARGELQNYHLLHAARADLLRRKGDVAQARSAYEKAITLSTNDAETRYLQRRLGEIAA